MQLAQDELDDRSVVSQLKSAFGTGPVKGMVGQLNLDAVDVDNLEAAIHYAHHIGCKTVVASQMLATAQLVRRLRQVWERAADFMRVLSHAMLGDACSGFAGV